MNFTLDEKTLKLVEKTTGMDKAQLRETSLVDIEKSSIKDSFYLAKKPRERFSRGSVYLFLHRVLSLAKVERYLSRI
jgi:hypothetical protein